MTWLPSQPDSPIQIYEFAYTPWYHLTIEQQSDSLKNQDLILKIPHGRISVNEDEAFVIAVKSPDIISWVAGKGSELNFRILQQRLIKS